MLRLPTIATVDATDVVITDDLDLPVAGQLAYVAGSATLDGVAADVAVAGSLLTADYEAANGPLAPGATTVLRFRATIDPGLAFGTTVTNEATVMWNDPAQLAQASVSLDVGGMPGVAALGGTLWHDADFDDVQGAGEDALAGWEVEFYRNGTLVTTVTSDAAGAYLLAGLAPNDVSGDQYEVRFRAPGAGPRTALLGVADSAFTNDLQRISDIVVGSGAALQGLNLPIDPNGVVYDAVQRTPVGGATLRLLDASQTALPTGCFDDPAQQGQVTRGDGFYKFDLNFSLPACNAGDDYLLYVDGANGFSSIIPPTSDANTPPFSVPGCTGGPDDAVPATAQHCEAQPSAQSPAASVGAGSAGTRYYVHLTLDDSQVPGSSQLFNNHLAVDSLVSDDVAVIKTTPKVNVSRGDLVPYEITVINNLDVELATLGIRDRIPTGFRYVEGSAQIDGEQMEPEIGGQPAHLARALGRSGREHDAPAAAGGGCRGHRGRVREPSLGDRERLRNAAHAAGDQATVRVVPDIDLRLYGRDRQGLRRCQSRRRTRTRASAGWRASELDDAAWPRASTPTRTDVSTSPAPIVPQRGARQQLRPQARRPHTARAAIA